jgi:hypothetical protein
MNAKFVRNSLSVVAVTAVLWGGAGVTARPSQSAAAPPRQEAAQKAPPKPVIPLKITIVISRYQGEKRTASLPFTLMVNTSDRSTSLRMSNEVPYPVTTAMPTKEVPVLSYQYKAVGTNIDCTAETTADDGRFRLQVTISDSQIFSDAAPAIAKGLPSFQSFTSQSALLLRDGQTIQYTTATDKITAEVVKVDVTMNVVK